MCWLDIELWVALTGGIEHKFDKWLGGAVFPTAADGHDGGVTEVRERVMCGDERSFAHGA
ncbi:hypothetical protein GCM10025762_51230 [Haloechinothrix salitolerans]